MVRTNHKDDANEDLQWTYDKQEALNSLLWLSLEDIPLNKLLRRTLDLLTTISWIALESKGAIFLVDDQPEVLVMEAHVGLTGPIQAACARLPFGRCICGIAASTRRIQFAAELDERHNIHYEGMTPHGHYCIPILSGKHLLGVMNLYVKKGHRRSPKEELFLTAIANTLAGIIMRRKAEAAQHRREQEFRLLVKNVPAIVFKGYVDGSVDFLDDKIKEMTGYSKEEFDSRQLKWTDLILEENLPRTIIQALKRSNPYVMEYAIKSKEDTVIWVQERSHLICDQTGKVDHISGVLFDITERKRAEEKLRVSETNLRYLASKLMNAQERERERISRDLHDELGQSLMLLKLQVEQIEYQLDSKQADIRKECRNALANFDLLIENVRRLSRDLIPTILQDFGLSAALEHLIKEFSNLHNIQTKIKLLLELDDLFHREAQLNIYRIIQESLTNIGKYAQASSIMINVTRNNDQIFFLIEDNGVGFEVEKVLASDSTSRGLGLAAMEERVKMLGGTLQIKSQKSKGTKILFSLPVPNPK